MIVANFTPEQLADLYAGLQPVEPPPCPRHSIDRLQLKALLNFLARGNAPVSLVAERVLELVRCDCP